METLSNQLFEIAIKILSSVLVTLICIGTRYAISWLKTKANSEKMQTALFELEKAVAAGIFFVEQTIVSTSKKRGTWDDAAKAEAKSACVQYVRNVLSPSTCKAISGTGDELAKLISDMIESKIGQIHYQ